MIASRERSRFELDWWASVFAAPSSTRMRPAKTPREAPSRMPLKSSRLVPCGTACSITEWLSTSRWPSAHVEAREVGLGSLAGEAREDVAAREGGAQRGGVGGEAGVLPLLDRQGREVEGRGRLVLHLVVVEAGAGAERDLGDRVGERRLVAERHVGLDEGRLAPRFGDQEDAGVARRRAVPGHGGEDQLHAPPLASPPTWTKAPSPRKAAFSAANGRPSTGTVRARLGSTRPGETAMACWRLAAWMPAGRPWAFERSARKRPFTKTRRGPKGLPAARSRSAAETGAAGSPCPKAWAASGASEVNRQSSCRVVGRPVRSKASRPERRAAATNSGAGGSDPAPATRLCSAPFTTPPRRSPSSRARGPARARPRGRCARPTSRGCGRARCTRAAAGSG